MAKGGSNANWSLPDENALLEYLWDQRSEAGEGVSFKAPTFTGAAAKVQATTTKGAPKTMSSCKNKWGKVCCLITTDSPHSDRTILQLKELYLAICDIKSQSGFTWSDENGATIGPESASVWEVYVKVSYGYI